MALTSLSKVAPGHQGTVKEIRGTGLFFNRLRALGMRPETVVAVIKKAPFGDPLEICIGGQRLAIRKHEAEHILLALA